MFSEKRRKSEINQLKVCEDCGMNFKATYCICPLCGWTESKAEVKDEKASKERLDK